jgi:hypothetical protein
MAVQERDLRQLQLRYELWLPVQLAEYPRLLSAAFVGNIVGHFNDTPLAGLNWAGLYKWPGESAEAFKRYSYRPPEDDSDCFNVTGVWYCP